MLQNNSIKTNLALVSSRYYSPELCRFLSSDDIEYLDSESVNGLDLYCYCLDNPINYIDPSGHIAFWLACGLVLGAIGLIGGGTQYMLPEKIRQLLESGAISPF